MNARGRQLGALGFCAFTLPAVLLLPSAGWLWAGGASLVSAALLGLLLYFGKNRPLPLAQAAAAKPLGKALLLLALGWNVLALGAVTRTLCAIFPTAEKTPLIGLLLLLLAAYAAQKKRSLPVGAICFFFLLGLYGLLFGFSLPDLQKEYLNPVQNPKWTVLTSALAPMGLIYLLRGEKGKPILWLLGGVIFALLAALITAGSLSPQVASRLEFPFYEAAKSITLLGSIQRLEPLVSAGLCAGGFCLLSLLCAVNGELLGVFLPRGEKLSGPVNFFLGAGCFWLSGLLSGEFFALGTTIFWGLLPFLLQLLVTQKNIKIF